MGLGVGWGDAVDGVRPGWLWVPLSVGHQGCTPTPRLNGGFKRTTLVCSPVLLGDGSEIGELSCQLQPLLAFGFTPAASWCIV